MIGNRQDDLTHFGLEDLQSLDHMNPGKETERRKPQSEKSPTWFILNRRKPQHLFNDLIY